MIAIRTNGNNEVVEIRYNAKGLRDGESEVDEIPQCPLLGEDETAVLVFDGANIGYRIDKLPRRADELVLSPTHEEIEATRAAAYRQTVDPLTCEIQRLRDMGGTQEEIAEAEARREKAVAAIREQYPYPEEING